VPQVPSCRASRCLRGLNGKSRDPYEFI